MMGKIIIAIDGPAGSGKSTTARILAEKLGYIYIDTGAMYRAVTYLAMEMGIVDDPEKVSEIAKNSDFNLDFFNGETQVTINNIDVTEAIRSPIVNEKVSFVSKILEVRNALVEKQRKMGEAGNVVMEGRDIGTVVFPEAQIKVFLTATLDKRVDRRLKEFKDKGKRVEYESVKDNLVKRDTIDSTRDASPLIKAHNAIEIDTSYISVDEQVKKILELVEKLN